MAPTISIIIPVYNGAAYLAEAIASAQAQEGVAAPQVIVVDDGSGDDSAAIARGFDGVEVIAQANAGVSAARNRGLQAATGSHVIFLDADDVLYPQAAALHLAALVDAPGVAFVYGAKQVIDAAGHPQQIHGAEAMRFQARDMAEAVRPTPSHCLYRRADLEAVGGFDARERFSEDMDLHLRLMALETPPRPGLSHGGLVVKYRLHDGQATRRMLPLVKGELALLRRHYGPGGAHEDAAVLRAGLAARKRYFGPLMAAGAVRALRRGAVGETIGHLGAFLRLLPHSAAGLADYARRRRA